MKYLLFLCFIFPLVSQAELTPKQIIAQKIAFIAFHSGVNENVAVEIAICESGLNQKARSHTSDVGIMQINTPSHAKTAKAKGWDIYNSAEDNIRMGLYLIKKDGAYRHYKASAKCWLPKIAYLPTKDV